MKRLMIALVICIPLASVCFGGVMFYFAFTSNDQSVLDDQAPMSKTSWRSSAENETVDENAVGNTSSDSSAP
ncbi:MAG: hypothetical protein V2I41_11265 [Pseudomonadales bacterium]|jgi:hypothetical protein|nr:hypothetical protein [Pseudomonadales bacterium]